MADEAWLAIHLCTGPTRSGEANSIQPLVKYLETGRPLTPYLRDWLVKLLKGETETGHYLEYNNSRRGRRPSLDQFAENSSIYSRACELRSTFVTKEFLESLVETTGMKIAARNDADPVFRLGDGASDDPEFIDPVLTFKLGKLLNNDQVHKIIVKESEWLNDPDQWVSLSTVKRILKDRDEASAID
jgi:hypothetical protein